MRLTRTALTLATVLLPSLASAQAITPLKLDLTALVPSRDSFVVMINGGHAGFLLRTIERGPNRITEKQHSEMMGMIVNATLEMDDAGRPISAKTDGDAGGMPIRIHVSYANGRAKTEGTMPGADGPRTLAGDTAVSPATLDESSLPTLLSYAPLASGAKFTTDLFTGTAGALTKTTIEVSAKETVVVPAGTFEAYKVTYSSADQSMVVYYSTAPGHRLLKMTPVGQPIEIVLVR